MEVDQAGALVYEFRGVKSLSYKPSEIPFGQAQVIREGSLDCFDVVSHDTPVPYKDEGTSRLPRIG